MSRTQDLYPERDPGYSSSDPSSDTSFRLNGALSPERPNTDETLLPPVGRLKIDKQHKQRQPPRSDNANPACAGAKRHAKDELFNDRKTSPSSPSGPHPHSAFRSPGGAPFRGKHIYRGGGQSRVRVSPTVKKSFQQESSNHHTTKTTVGDGRSPNPPGQRHDRRIGASKSASMLNNPMPAPLHTELKTSALVKQPDSSPISADQLATEVKGIYAGLVMVEAKCINIDAAQAADPKADLGADQWQALIALHRTLLYEHHDFLMATQHPSANDTLRGLATKYSMPARMWKHGIHAFLEVLRHRRPASQDYMLAFIYLAYQMMALLYETVRGFKDTWIECLGDLARYRMAIEDDRELHTLWGGVAARWYTLASDRHPNIGRLNHHLGILERPSLRKMFYYAKSLTCVLPFPNAKDSMGTLCEPILTDRQLMANSNQPAEARLMLFHALLFSKASESAVDQACREALAYFEQEKSPFVERVGVSLAVSNVAGILEWGAPTNRQRHCFAIAVGKHIQSTRPPNTDGTSTSNSDRASFPEQTTHVPHALSFTNACFNSALRLNHDRPTIEAILGFVHIMLSWYQGILKARALVEENVDDYYTLCALLDGDIDWTLLCVLLNTLAQYYPLDDRIISYAEQGRFLMPEGGDYKPLCEDYLTRGLIFLQLYWPRDYFDGKLDHDGRSIENSETRKMRAERVLWLGIWMAKNCDYFSFDLQTQRFSVLDRSATGRVTPSAEHMNMAAGQLTPPQDSGSLSSVTLSAKSDPDVDPESEPTLGWATVDARPKQSKDPAIQGFDEDEDMSVTR